MLKRDLGIDISTMRFRVVERMSREITAVVREASENYVSVKNYVYEGVTVSMLATERLNDEGNEPEEILSLKRIIDDVV